MSLSGARLGPVLLRLLVWMVTPSEASTAKTLMPLPDCGAPKAYDFKFLWGIDFRPDSYSSDPKAFLATRDGNVFWSDASDTPISKANFDAETWTPLVMRVESPEGMVFTDDAIFWLEELNKHIPGYCTGRGRRLRRARLDGSGALVLGEWPNCADTSADLLADDTHLYFLTSVVSPTKRFIRKMPLAGGPSEVLVDLGIGGDHVFGLAQDETYLYWTERGYGAPIGNGSMVRRVAKAGGAPETLLDGFYSPRPGLLLFEGSLVFAAEVSFRIEQILQVPMSGGAATTLVEIPPVGFTSRYVRRLRSDGTNLYWILTDNTLNTVPLSGGSPVTLATDLDYLVDLAAGDGYAFWTENPLPTPDRAAVKRVAAMGGAVETLVSGLQSPGVVTFSNSRA